MSSRGSTIFVGSGFTAKYPEGGGNFSVVLQYLLGLRRLGRRGIWLETMREGATPEAEQQLVATFRRRLQAYGLGDSFALLITDAKDRPLGRSFGLRPAVLQEMLRGPNILLNLSYSIKPPLLERFERRILCSLDPTEICFWMQRMEMGQSHHHEFATIGLNINAPDSRVPASPVRWKTFFPLVDTALLQPLPRPKRLCFSTVGQWYWDGNVQWEGEWRDFSKKAAFEKFLTLPELMPSARWTLAMNLNNDDPERARIRGAGWHFVHPHTAARTPSTYYRFIGNSTAEFSAVKLESYARSGWLSDRSAAYLALGRPVITEPTSATRYLPDNPGLFFVNSAEEAAEAARRVAADWQALSRRARATARACFDAAKNLRHLLD